MRLIAVCLIALALPATAIAADIVSATSRDGHPAVTWTMPPGWCSNVIEVSSSSTVGSDGSFFNENFVDGGLLKEADTSWLSSRQSLTKPGTYYVRVQTYPCDYSGEVTWSNTATITVSPPAPVIIPAPKVSFLVRGWNGSQTTTGAVSKLKRDGRYIFVIKTSGEILSRSTFQTDGKFCIVTKTGNRCTQALLVHDPLYLSTRITPKMVVSGKVTVFATYEGRVIAKKSFKVS